MYVFVCVLEYINYAWKYKKNQLSLFFIFPFSFNSRFLATHKEWANCIHVHWKKEGKKIKKKNKYLPMSYPTHNNPPKAWGAFTLFPQQTNWGIKTDIHKHTSCTSFTLVTLHCFGDISVTPTKYLFIIINKYIIFNIIFKYYLLVFLYLIWFL